MASYPALKEIGQEYILEEQYKALFGYPNGKVNFSLSSEVPGTSRPFILQNQIYSQEIPITPPILDASGSRSIGGNPYNYKYSTLYPYLEKYTEVPLSNKKLSQSSTETGSGALTWWFLESGNADSREKQLEYNILSPGVPNNLNPGGLYTPTLYIVKDGKSEEYNFGNGNYPWTYNVNSGIVLFTGSSKYLGTGTPVNNTPSSDDTITFTFWRYNGTFGTPSATTYWQAITTPISGIGYGALSVENSSTGSIYTQNILANDTTANENLYTNLTTGSLSIGSTGTNCQINSNTTFISNFDIFNPNQNKTATISYINGSALNFINPQLNAGFYFTKGNDNNLVTFTTGGSTFYTTANFTSTLSARTNLKLYEWVNKIDNTITLTFPMEQTISLRVSSGTTMTVVLPALTSNEVGMVFTFVKLSSNVNVTLTTNNLNNIYTLNNLNPQTPLTSDTTLLSSDKITTTLAVGKYDNSIYWIEVSSYSTFDRDYNNTIYPRLEQENTFTQKNTFNSDLYSSNLKAIDTTGTQSLYTNLTTINGVTGSLTIGSTGTNSIFNSALVVGGTATFNTYVPECGVTATSGNQLTNKDYVDNKFVDVTSEQSVGGTKTFTNDMLTTNIFTNDLIWRLDSDPTNVNVLQSTLTYNSNSNKNELYFHPFFKNNSYKFQCINSDVNFNSEKSLYITYEKTTIETALEVGGTATFTTYAPESGVTATSGNQLTNKTYVDSKIGGGTTNQILNFSPTEVTNIKKSIIYRKATTITTNSILARLDNPPTIQQVYTFGKKIDNLWVAVGQGTNTIAYSNDGINCGINWIGINGPFGVGDFHQGNAVAWNGQIWVAVGSGDNTIAWSDDGKTWTAASTNPFTSSTILNNVACNGQRWVAVGADPNGSNCKLAWSDDGKNWYQSTNNPFTTTGYPFGIAWNGQIWVLVGSIGTGNNTIYWSFDGKTWYQSTNNPFTSSGNGVAWNGQIWVAVGSGTGNNTIYWSFDGKTWYQSTNNPFTSSVNGVAWNGQIWVAVGSGTNKIGYSYDGINWTAVTTNPFTSSISDIAWNGNLWVIVGSGNYTFAWSIDGKNWTASNNNPFTLGRGVAFNSARQNTITFVPPPITVAGGFNDGNKIGYSSDGISWSESSSGNTVFAGTADNGVYDVATNGTVWVAGGLSTSNSLGYSLNGKDWIGLGNTVFGTCWGAAWNGTIWVAVGSGTNVIAWSNDGIGWTGLGTGYFTPTGTGFGVASNGNTWVAVGQGTNKIIYSYDGNGTWYNSTNGNDIFNTGWCIASNGSRWVAGGEGSSNTIAYSDDGQHWTGLGTTIFTSQCRGVAWNGQIWVAVGSSTTYTIAYSSNGIDWQIDTNGNDIFDNNIVFSVAWNGNTWVAAAQGTNKIGYSYDGKIWYKSDSGKKIFYASHGVASNYASYSSSYSASNGNITIPNNSIVLSAGDQLDVVCDSYYNTGFTNCSISIDA